MSNHELQKLRNELRQAGATAHEAESLVTLAASLHHLKGLEPSVAHAQVFTHRRSWRLLLGSLAFGALLVASMVVLLSQSSLPGNWLYPLKRTSENVIVAIAPSYSGVIMMHRAQEVGQLVAHHQNSRLLTIALSGYKLDVIRYKAENKSDNYTDLTYCRKKLQQAASMTSGQEHTEIVAALASAKSDID